jgi:putative transposase
MGRPRRAADGGLIYHVLNRANAGMTILQQPEDYVAFERVLEEAVERTKTRLLAYCVMSTHWHMVVWPQEDGELSRFTGWLSLTHTQRWHAHRHSAGSGHLYHGRFKVSLRQACMNRFEACGIVGCRFTILWRATDEYQTDTRSARFPGGRAAAVRAVANIT